ncbi:MAG: sulfotransferase domain-containing protein [Anaerolineae bacterium]|nr:sulfotransferase domain-containing protein [Anaerolineae bacterium]
MNQASPTHVTPIAPARDIRLPDFMIAGAQKSGTTSLHNYLESHSQVYFPEQPQELHYFDIDENFNKGLAYYESFFREAQPEQTAIGQTSPLYIYEPQAPARIAQLLPQVKLIFILRNPVERAYSHYWHSVKKGYETVSFEKALELESNRLRQGASQRRNYSYVDRGYYSRQLERFLKLFSRDQILVLLTEELSRETAATLDRCCDFLNIDRQGAEIVNGLNEKRWNTSGIPRFPAIQRLTAPWRFKSALVDKIIWRIDRLNLKQVRYSAMDSATREKLETIFAPEYERLAALFNLDLAAWSKPTASKNQVKDSS